MSIETYFTDIWFSGLKTSEEAMSKGVYCCGPVKTSHKGFCLATLEKLTKVGYEGLILLCRVLQEFLVLSGPAHQIHNGLFFSPL